MDTITACVQFLFQTTNEPDEILTLNFMDTKYEVEFIQENGAVVTKFLFPDLDAVHTYLELFAAHMLRDQAKVQYNFVQVVMPGFPTILIQPSGFGDYLTLWKRTMETLHTTWPKSTGKPFVIRQQLS